MERWLGNNEFANMEESGYGLIYFIVTIFLYYLQ
jgi:hypothetical protein